MNYSGTLEDLRTIITGCGFNISEVQDQEHCHSIRTTEGAILNWYPSTTKISIQGKKPVRDKLSEAFATYTGSKKQAASSVKASDAVPEVRGAKKTTANKKVFLVHGHDTVSREQLELVLHKLGLDPFVLANTGGSGLTIIEALEKEIGPKDSQARFGIVLMTPDDIGYSKIDGETAAQPRARQNVVLEMGMLISAVGRGNVAILKKGHLEVPSDASGILYIPYNDHVKETVPKLSDRLTKAGFVLNPAKITHASS